MQEITGRFKGEMGILTMIKRNGLTKKPQDCRRYPRRPIVGAVPFKARGEA